MTRFIQHFILVFFLLLLGDLPSVKAQNPVPMPTTPKVSCPVSGGQILTPSFQADPVNGHCGSSYGYSCTCGSNGRRAKAIDIPTTPNTDVILPSIEGENITWRLAETLCAGGGSYPNCTDSNGGTGGTITFIGTDPAQPNDKWYIQFLHLKISTILVEKGGSYPPGTVVGKTDSSAHVHTTIGKNLNVSGDNISGTADCDTNWLPTDFICDPSKQPSAANLATQPTGISSGEIKSNYVCTKVGNPTEDIPSVCKNPSGETGTPGKLTYYCQGDPRWDNRTACGTGQIGCGPTSVAMIMSYFGENVTPAETFSTYQSNNLISCDLGSYPDKVNSYLRNNGYEVGPSLVAGGILDAVAAKTYLDKGYLILGSSNNFLGQKGGRFGHIFVVENVDPQNETFSMRDPENCKYETGAEITQNIVQPIKSNKIPNWAYAYPIKRKDSTATP